MNLDLPLATLTANRCNFRGCTNELPTDAPFKMCEVCRTMYVTERVTLLVDPFSSREKHVKDKWLSQLITGQTAAEVLQMRSNLEFLYLEYSKVIKLHGIEPTTKRVKQTLEEQVEDARKTGSNVKTRSNANVAVVKEKLNKLQKQMKALGCKDPSGKKGLCVDCAHEREARRIFNDVAPDGDLGF